MAKKPKSKPFDHCISKQVMRRFIAFYLQEWDQFKAEQLNAKT